jgi:hypothetical protein
MPSSTSLIVLLLLAAVSVAERHNLSDCHSQIGDRLLAEKSSARSFKFLGYVSGTIYIDVGEDNIINCVKAIDK